MQTELLISDGSGAFIPSVLDGVELTTERSGTAGKLTFKVLADAPISEGAAVRFSVDGRAMFFGFVFTQRRDKEGMISVTAYDQIRYLAAKDTYVYENKTASQVIAMIAADLGLRTGTLEDTKYIIPSRVEDNTALLDIIGNALDLTLANTGEMFVLYDYCGALTLRNLASMAAETNGKYLVIDGETGENFDYSSSIDSGVYNKIKLAYEDPKTGAREVYIAQNGAHIGEWGVLQYYGTLSKDENGLAKADALLKLYDRKSRSLKVANALGDTRVRGGSLVAVDLDLGDIEVRNFMLVEKVTHKFSCDEHLMTLQLSGA